MRTVELERTRDDILGKRFGCTSGPLPTREARSDVIHAALLILVLDCPLN